MEALFTPEYKVLNELFGRDTKYTIPEYQRPYSWDCLGKSDKNNQVNVMWEDLINYFENNNPNPYFFGSMVLVGQSSTQDYIVIDGQQRLTTLTILFVSIKCFLQNSRDKVTDFQKDEIISYITKAIELIDDIIFNKKIFGAQVQEKKVKIEKISGFDYDNSLKIAMECGDIKKLDLSTATEEQKIVSSRYFDNRKYFEKQLTERFYTDDKFSYKNAEELNNFIEFLKQKVAIVRILASRFEVAYQIFEILNNRGLPLSNKDLFRNFIIKEFHELKLKNSAKYDSLNPNQNWTFLEDNYELDNDFISRWVESRKASNQQYSAFNDLKEIFKTYEDSLEKSAIESFYEDLTKDLDIYSKIKNTNTGNDVLDSKLQVILNAGNTTYSMNFLLSLFRQCEFNEQNEFEVGKILDIINVYERYLLYLLLGPSKRFSSKPIYAAIKALHNNNLDAVKNEFRLEDSETNKLKELINGEIKDNDIAKLLIAKYFWIFDAETADDDTVYMELNYNDSTLEHIIPQSPDSDSNWLTDFNDTFRKDMTYKLGNMTLLTQRKNSSAKNFSFDKKKEQYKKTKLALTSEIAEKDELTEDFFTHRQHKIVAVLLKDLQIDIG